MAELIANKAIVQILFDHHKHQVLMRIVKQKLNKKNYCEIGLKDWKELTGWIIEDQADFISISFSRPEMMLNPFSFDESALTYPLQVPKENIVSFVKILKE